MLKVGQLIKHLSLPEVENNEILLSFRNYLSHFIEEASVLHEDHIENYFSLCLDFTHWQQNKIEFGEVLKPLLSGHLDLKAIRWPDNFQYFEVESMTDLTDILQCYLNALLKNGEKYRLILDSDKRVFAIILNPDNSLQVRIFDRKVVIRHGQLEPLKKYLTLSYTSNLELRTDLQQIIELAPFITASFRVSESSLEGAVIKGYSLQKSHDLKGLMLPEFPKLFFTIKHIEQYFVQRPSDPFYQETIDELESAIEKARLAEIYDHQEFLDVLTRAHNALEYVYKGDKLISLLIRDLQHSMPKISSRSQQPREI